jgi:hypothetical protein
VVCRHGSQKCRASMEEWNKSKEKRENLFDDFAEMKESSYCVPSNENVNNNQQYDA